MEACYFRWDPVAICCFHAVRCASKLRANKLSDVAEGAGYFYDQIAITSSCLVAIREEVDLITDGDVVSWAAPQDGGLSLLAVGVVDNTSALVNNDALVVEWYLMV